VAFVPPADGEQSTRRRILAATFLVLARDDRRKLQLSELHCWKILFDDFDHVVRASASTSMRNRWVCCLPSSATYHPRHRLPRPAACPGPRPTVPWPASIVCRRGSSKVDNSVYRQAH
jgi:hypothetical protein